MLILNYEVPTSGEEGSVSMHEDLPGGRVLFGSYRQPRGRGWSPPKLRWFAPEDGHASFAELRTAKPHGWLLAISAGDFDVFLNGRKVQAPETRVADGEVLRIERERWTVGRVSSFPRDPQEAAFLAKLQLRASDDETRLV